MSLYHDPDRYPVDALVPKLKAALSERGVAVLQADPGAGKSTRIPLWLLDEPWLAGGKVLVLEPRRVAAALIANRLAETLNERVGETVGIRMRLDTRVGPKTRIEVITEGVLNRMIQDDPELPRVRLIVFDEFHERNLNGDVGLALALDVRSGLRDDLKLLVMSATLDAIGVAAFLDDAPILTSEGRVFPVQMDYLEFQSDRPLPERCADAIVRALTETDEGDLLVFFPGEPEIDRCARSVAPRLPDTVELRPLFGRLSLADQKAALAPAPKGLRKVVLATNLAESSVTVQGVRVVVDSGYEKVIAVDPDSGMSRLRSQWISRASADQRCGRAGREGPGTCYRLWTKPFHERMRTFSDPEIVTADLAPTVLEMAAWGARSPDGMTWVTPPPQAVWDGAAALLKELGAVDDHTRITDLGKAMAKLPVHPRLGRLIVGATNPGDTALACEIASLLSERDLLDRNGDGCDLRRRIDLLRGEARGGSGGRARRATRLAKDLRRRVCAPERATAAEATGKLLAMGYPDRIAAKREGATNRYLLANGKGCILDEADPLAGTPFLVVAELTGGPSDATIRLAAPVDATDLMSLFSDRIVQRKSVIWDDRLGRVVATVSHCFGEIPIRSGPLADPDQEQMVKALVEGIRKRGLTVLDWNKKAAAVRDRLAFLHRHISDTWPDVGDDALLESLETWLAPHLVGCSKLADLAKVKLDHALLDTLDWNLRRDLDRLAPERFTVPSGRTVAIDYSTPERPALFAQIQWMFGSTDTPRVLDGRVPLTIHLTSPAQRPVQVTDDLKGFWEGSYALVRKELRGRYPKHYWPENPLEAEPTNRTKKKM